MKRHFIYLMLAGALTAGGCATLKGLAHDLGDAADIACAVFADEHPQEFKTLVMQRMPHKAVQSLEQAGWAVEEICKLKDVKDYFLGEQRRLQKSSAARLARP